jgi:hypothetical protein
MTPNSQPLLAFVHVPKTAGSSVNHYLHAHSPYGAGHIEGNLTKEIEHLDWVSGHVSKAQFDSLFKTLNRKVDVYSTVRDPFSQLCSSINWYIEATHRKIMEVHYVEEDKSRAIEICNTDFSNEEAVITLLERHKDAFFGVQSYLICGRRDLENISTWKLNKILRSFKFIAHENTMSELYQSFSFATANTKLRPFENKSLYHFDVDFLKTGKLGQFIRKMNASDEMIYAAVRRHFVKHHLGVPCRHSYQLANEINFQEAAYLEANHDVALAVQNGETKSGRSHFDQYGLQEGRRLKFSPLPKSNNFKKWFKLQ